MNNLAIGFNPKLARQISIFCVIMQSIGIRFFDGLSILLMGIVFILNINNLSRLREIAKPLNLIFLVLAIGAVMVIKGLPLISILYLLATIFSSILLLLNYSRKRNIFLSDVKPVLWLFAIYGFIAWLMVAILPGLFSKVRFGQSYYTFLYLIYNISVRDSIIPRLSSLCWEPGCCQFLLNFLLLILISQKEKTLKIVFVAILVILTRSTTGYINLIVAALLYISLNKKYIIPISIAFTLLFSVGLYSMISSNIVDKFENTSGIIRTRDFSVGYHLTLSHPLFGVDVENLSQSREAQILEDEVWGGANVWTNTQGYFAGGFTNGLFGVLLDYGFIIGVILLWMVTKAPIIRNSGNKISPLAFYVVFFTSLIGEPISRTSLFFFFALSYIVNRRKAVLISSKNY